MENYVTAQLAAFGQAALLGWLAGCLYDLLRSVRLRRRRDRALTHTLDVLYALLLALALLCFALRVGQGQLRLYMLIGSVLGAVLYFWAFRGLFRPLWAFWTEAGLSALKLLAVPISFLIRFVKKIGDYIKKYFHFLRRCATIKKYQWEFNLLHREREKKEGRVTHAKEKKDTKAPQLHRNSRTSNSSGRHDLSDDPRT